MNEIKETINERIERIRLENHIWRIEQKILADNTLGLIDPSDMKSAKGSIALKQLEDFLKSITIKPGDFLKAHEKGEI